MAEKEVQAVVKVTRTSMVKPAIPTSVQTMFLSSLDLLFLPFNNSQRLLFYTLPPANDYSSTIETLKKTLSSVMVYFYPLAGRLRSCESGRPEIDCNDGGVKFTEATINIPFQDLEKDGFRHKPFFRKLVHEVNDSADEYHSRSLLSIQVTSFEGGGMCIGTTIHHVMADGNSFWHFMTSWADCSRGLPIGKPPQLDRTVLKRKKSPVSISFKAHEIVSQGITGAKIFKFVPDSLQSDQMKTSGTWNMEKSREVVQKWDDRKKETEVVYSTFCFTEDMIQELKQRSGAQTSFVAVSAHFWRCVMRARDVPREEAVYFLVLANCRERIQAPLLPTFFGNCLSMGVAQMSADTLINQHISFAADVIQQLINSCTEEVQIDYLIDWAEFPNRNLLTLVGEAGWEFGTDVVSSPKFPVYEMDYGWGKPSNVQMADMKEIGSMILSCSKDGDKSILVSTWFPQHQMDFLHHLIFSAE